LEALLGLAFVLAAALAWFRTAAEGWRGGAVLLGVAALGAWGLAPSERRDSARERAPAENPRDGYVSSKACLGCHPGPYASWHRSFHRTMTQVASRESVAAPFAGTRLEVEGRSIDLSERDGAFFATLPDPDLVAALSLRGVREPAREAPLVKREVVMTTGSHHYQAYWVPGARGNELRLLPVVYLIDEQRFVPRRDAFLQPPDAPAHALRWNSNCVQCHSVAGRPGHDEASDRFATEAAELGIACEACHGPGRAHVERHRSPLERFVSHFTREGDDSIVNPARLPADRASAICGQCHAYSVPRDEARFWKSGFAEIFRPGEPLEPSRQVLDFERDRAHFGSLVETELESIFWGDGTIRIGGREYNGLVASKCHTQGAGERRLGCLSCHSMHDSDPVDQLSSEGRGDRACASCHAEQARAGAAHTHHAPDSPGSRCYGCHMPFTSYALFKGIRSHRVDSPSVENELLTGRPNACNGCHADRSLGWTAAKLEEWYGLRAPALGEAERGTSATLRALYQGDAAERALAAFALGQPETRRAAGSHFQAPHLASLLDDPYSAVRLVAWKSLRGLPGFAGFDYDFLSPREQRKDAVRRAIERAVPRPELERKEELLFRPDGSLDTARIETLLQARDERPITISE
jgi:predicted CXXCH cytochrome family protein